MAYFKVNSGASHASQLIINAVNRLRHAKLEMEAAEALVSNMSDQEILDDVGFSGTGTQLKTTLAGAVTALNSSDVTNLVESLNW
jgi:hypothetical protein